MLAGIIDGLKAIWDRVANDPRYVVSNRLHVLPTKLELSCWASEIVGEYLSIEHRRERPEVG
jgi:hypothetical protein